MSARIRILSGGLGVVAVAASVVAYLRMEATTIQGAVFVRSAVEFDAAVREQATVSLGSWYSRFEFWYVVAALALVLALAAALIGIARSPGRGAKRWARTLLLLGAFGYVATAAFAHWDSGAYSPGVGVALTAAGALVLASAWRRADKLVGEPGSG